MKAPPRKVEIVDYDPAWVRAYEIERRRICAAISYPNICVEHIGSTAVPGLAAKPIIDILIGVPRLRDAVDCIPRLTALGYHYVPGIEVNMPYRRFLQKGNPRRRTHHVHILEPHHIAWRQHVRFRDYLRTHRATAREYEALKRRLARRYAFDIAAYTQSKGEFVRAVLEKAERRSGKRRNPNAAPWSLSSEYERVLNAIAKAI